MIPIEPSNFQGNGERERERERERVMASCGEDSTSIPTVEELEALGDVWNQTFSFVTSMSLKCAVELRIPDAVHDNGGSITLHQLCAALSIAPVKLSALRCLMRLLVHNGCFAKQAKSSADEDDVYVLTPMSKLLVSSKHAGSDLVLLQLDSLLIEMWLSMSKWFRGDECSAFETAHGTDFFHFLTEHPEFAATFNAAVERDSALVGGLLVERRREVFDGIQSMVDVTGRVHGNAALACKVAQSFPGMKCSVLDLPHFVNVAACSNAGKPKNLNFVEGDMFEHIPPADLILFRWVLMNWKDEECVKILKRCREALEASKSKGRGKVVIIEIVLKDGERLDKSTETQLHFDMAMVVARGSKQRDEQEWSKLFTEAGFSNYKITPFGLRSLIEVFP